MWAQQSHQGHRQQVVHLKIQLDGGAQFQHGQEEAQPVCN